MWRSRTGKSREGRCLTGFDDLTGTLALSGIRYCLVLGSIAKRPSLRFGLVYGVHLSRFYRFSALLEPARNFCFRLLLPDESRYCCIQCYPHVNKTYPNRSIGRFAASVRLSLAGIGLYGWIIGSLASGQEQAPLVPAEPIEAGGISGEDTEATRTTDSITSEKNEVDLQEDGTVADALQRRPDLRFGNVTVDGEKSNVSLESMSAAAVDTVEVLKAVTPDVDADTLGGSVSVSSKPAYEQEKPTLQGRLIAVYRSEDERVNPAGSLTLGNSFGDRRQWGALFTVTAENEFSGSHNRSLDWKPVATEDGEVLALERMRVDQWHHWEKALEVSGVIDHQVNELLSFFVRGNYQQEPGRIYNPRLEMRFDDGDYVRVSDDSAEVENARVKRDLMAFEHSGSEWTTAVGGFFVSEKMDADFRLSYEQSTYLEPDFFIVDFEQNDVDLAYDLSDRQFPTFKQTDGDTIYSADLFNFDEMVTEIWSHDTSDLIATLNLKFKHSLGMPEDGFWKLGVKVRSRELDQRSDSLLHDGYYGEYQLDDVLSEFRNDTFFAGRYRLDPAVGWPDGPEFRDAHEDSFVLNERRSREISDPATYDARERVGAGYGMGSYETGPIRVLAGLRYEQTNIDYTGQEVVINEDGEYEATNVRKGESSYGNLFPGVHAAYRFSDRITLIGSWTETIKRPEYNDLVPYRFVNREDREVEEGNPELKPTLFSNFDLAMDLVTPGSGLLSLEVFAKQVRDYVYTQQSIVPDGPYAGYERWRQENGPDASITGVELTWAQKLGVVHEMFTPMAFNINYVWRSSSIEYPTRPNETLPLAGLPEQELTLALVYEKAWFFGQIEIIRSNDLLKNVGDVSQNDRYETGRTRIDIDTTYEVMAGVKLIAELDNITNAPAMNHYEADARYPTYLRSSAWQATLGVRWDL